MPNHPAAGRSRRIYSYNSLLTLLASIVKGNKTTTGFDNG